MIAPTASMNPAVVTAGPEFGLGLGRPISAVGEHIIAGVALVQQPIQLLAIVHGRIGHGIMPDQLVLGVREQRSCQLRCCSGPVVDRGTLPAAFLRGGSFHRHTRNRLTTTIEIGHFGDPGLPLADRVLAARAGILAVALCAYVLAALFAERRQSKSRSRRVKPACRRL
jgi:hypothetical protein